MKDAQKPNDRSLARFIQWLSEGRFEVPNFQREFVWKQEQINDLMRSIFCDYYIGSLLLWKGGDDKNFDFLSCEPISGYNSEEKDPTYIVLDGQQRLSAMYYAFFSPEKNLPGLKRRGFFFVHLDHFSEGEFKEAFEVRYAPMKREKQYQNHCFPLSTLGEADHIRWYDWIKEYREYWKRQEVEATDAENTEDAKRYKKYQECGEKFHKTIQETLDAYMISYTELDQKIDVGKICSIFTKINHTGTNLDTFDLLNALLTPKDIYLREMWKDASPKLEFVKGRRFNTYIPRVMSIILQQGNCSPQYLYRLIPGGERIVDKDDFMRRWHDSVNAFEKSIGVLQDPREKFGAISAKYLPYPAMTPVFTALRIVASDADPYEQIAAFRKIRHWYWASVFTKRYSSSVESKTASDFSDVLAWINGADDPAVIREFQKVGLSDLRGVRSGAIYRGIINLLVVRGSFDWITGAAPTPAKIDDHHIIPQWWGNREGLGNDRHTILNRTLLSEETNRNIIGGSLPNEYLRRLMKQEGGEDRVRKIFESHLISPEAFDILLRDPFTREDFGEFISARERTIRGAIGPLLIEEHLDLDSPLPELDESIRGIELALRACIADALAGDVSLLPSDPLIRAEQQITQYLKTNPSADHEQHSKTLMGKLEHFDLRGLQQVLTNKGLWERFEPRFKTKELLNQRFEQLTGLRNPLAHSRPLGEVSRLEGEAAIKWFQRILKLEN